MHTLQNMVALERATRPTTNDSNISFSVERIDKAKAQKYLELNFKNNRALRARAIERLVDDMKNNRFHLGWDCIAFNEEGLLVNGQHRLNAVVEADVACQFCVLRNINHTTIKHFDTGNKRGQADRISVNGTPIHPKACAAIKLALGDFANNFTGVGRFGYTKYDDRVANYYRRHSEFFESLEQDGYMQARYTNNCLATALKIYVEMVLGKGSYGNYPHDMTAYERATFWLDLVVNGQSKQFIIDYNTDQSPFKLKEKLVTRKEKGQTMHGQTAYKLYVIAANYFMQGRAPNIRLDNAKKDPFTNFRLHDSTNKKGKGF